MWIHESSKKKRFTVWTRCTRLYRVRLKVNPPTLGDLSRAFLNSPDGFVSLRDRDVDNTIYDMYVSTSKQ